MIKLEDFWWQEQAVLPQLPPCLKVVAAPVTALSAARLSTKPLAPLGTLALPSSVPAVRL